MALEFWKKKSGPLPNWAWGAIGLGGAVAYSSWRRNKAAATEEEEPAESTTGLELPGNLPPTYVFQDMDTTNITVPSAPPGGGRPPTPPPVVKPPPFPRPPVIAKPVPKPTLPKPPVIKPGPAPKPPVGKSVTVAKWTARNPPWNSTIWGITNKLLGPKVNWKTVWEAPQNAALRAKRKDPTKIQAGDKVWVPGAK